MSATSSTRRSNSPRQRLSEKVALLRRNAISLAIGGVIAHLALVFLMVGVAILWSLIYSKGLGLSTGTSLFPDLWPSRSVSGIVGGILVAKAIRAFSKESLMPEKTIETLKEIKDGGLEQGPVKVYRATLPPQDDNRSSEQIRSDVEQTRTSNRTRGARHSEPPCRWRTSLPASSIRLPTTRSAPSGSAWAPAWPGTF
jgi:hypothetical protein